MIKGQNISENWNIKGKQIPIKQQQKYNVVGLVNIENKNTILPLKHLNVIIIRAL